MSRSDRYTIKQAQPVLYSDFLINLDRNPVSGNIARVTNEESVKQSIRNLILTNKSERFYDMNLGSKVQTMLFDLAGDDTETSLEASIREVIQNYEPRAKIEKIQVDSLPDNNTLLVTFIFSMVNIPQEISFNLILKRVR